MNHDILHEHRPPDLLDVFDHEYGDNSQTVPINVLNSEYEVQEIRSKVTTPIPANSTSPFLMTQLLDGSDPISKDATSYRPLFENIMKILFMFSRIFLCRKIMTTDK